MTIYAFEAQETWLPTVTGLTCTSVDVDDALLQIHFGTLRVGDDGIIDAQRTISLYGVWRVERGEEIVAASGDQHDHDVATALAILEGATLEGFTVSHPGFDLELTFSGGIVARSFPCNSAEFAEDVPDDADEEAFLISWWVDGEGVADDWEEPYDPQGV